MLYFSKVVVLVATLNIVLMPLSFADIYTCYNSGCLTMIDDSGDGFSWAIVCEDGVNASGHTAGAEYAGNCIRMM